VDAEFAAAISDAIRAIGEREGAGARRDLLCVAGKIEGAELVCRIGRETNAAPHGATKR
jgi:hypothetical protein